MLLIDSFYLKEFISKFGLLNFIEHLRSQIELDYARWDRFEKSPRHAVHVTKGVMELMPCSDGEYYSFKYVNGHPNNTSLGKLNIVGFGVLAKTATGMPCLMSEMTWLTAIRTACTSAMVTKYLGPKNPKTIGIVGCGSQSEFQILAVNQVSNCKNIYFFDKDPGAMDKFVQNLANYGLHLTACSNPSEVAQGSDILITSTGFKGHQSILATSDIKPGQLIIAIGGDCPGKTELSAEFINSMSEIWVEYLPQTKIEGEIQQIQSLEKVTELYHLVKQGAKYQRDPDATILFDGVGFALEDFSALKLLYSLVRTQADTPVKSIAPDLEDPKNLFGALCD